MATEEIKRAEKLWREQQITETLLAESENREEEKFLNVRNVESLETICCWENAIPNCKFAPAKKRRQIPVGQSKDDTMLNYSTMSDHSQSHRNYELDFANSPAWRICVEPKTYRYVPNNGRYRAAKLAQRLSGERDLHRMVGTRPNVEHRQLQKGIQRQLGREFEMYLKMELQRETTKVKDCKKDSEDSKKQHRSGTEINSAPPSQMNKDPPTEQEYSPVHLPPIKVIRRGESRKYMTNRLSALNEEIRKDSQAKKFSMPTSPEDGANRAIRSRSEPPGLGSLVDPGQSGYLHGGTGARRRSRFSFYEKSDAQVKELASQLVHALTELQKTQDLELKDRFNRDASNVELISKKKDDLQKQEAQKEKLNDIKAPTQKTQVDHKQSNEAPQTCVPLTHSVKYTTPAGDVISIPKFGRYSGVNNMQGTTHDQLKFGQDELKDGLLKPYRLKSSKSVSSGRSQVNGRVTPVNQYNRNDSAPKELLNNVITTTKCVSSNNRNRPNRKLSSLSGKQGDVVRLKGAENDPKVITDSFHSLPVGKHRHRERRGSSPLSAHRHGVLPEIAGRGLPKTVAPNRLA